MHCIITGLICFSLGVIISGLSGYELGCRRTKRQHQFFRRIYE